MKAAKKAKAEKSAEGGKPAKKPRKKKDKNAPKGALSAFMYFSNANREKVKTDNPGGYPHTEATSHARRQGLHSRASTQ